MVPDRSSNGKADILLDETEKSGKRLLDSVQAALLPSKLPDEQDWLASCVTVL